MVALNCSQDVRDGSFRKSGSRDVFHGQNNGETRDEPVRSQKAKALACSDVSWELHTVNFHGRPEHGVSPALLRRLSSLNVATSLGHGVPGSHLRRALGARSRA